MASFVTRPTLKLMLDVGPPARPPWRRGYGDYCFKASCELEGVGKVVGYDRYMGIAGKVENACAIRSAAHPGSTCSPANVTLLQDHRKECAGEIFFVVDGTSKRLLG